MASLDVQLQLTLQSPDRSFALAIDFAATAQRTALIGPSGSGKSTVLQAIAGLLPQVRGRVRVACQTLLDTSRGVDLPARERRVGVVFQDYALFPHMTVEQNLQF